MAKEKTDGQLISDYIRGDERAFTILYDRYSRISYALLRKMCHRSQVYVDDIHQDTWTKISLNIEKFDITQSFKAWACTIARNTAIDFFRSKANKYEFTFANFEDAEGNINIDDKIIDKSLSSEESVDIKLINDKIKKMPVRDQEILHIHLIQGYSLKEISEQLEMPYNTVKSRYFRALKIIKKEFNK